MKRLYSIIGMVLLGGLLRAGAQVDSGPLERHIQRLEAGIRSLGSKPFQHKGSNGMVVESYVVSPDSVSDFHYGSDGTLQVQWTLRRNGAVQYEAFYGPRRTKERLLEDDRSVSYSSFYPSGQKWEEYLRNKQKAQRSYDVYDKNGHLLKTDI